MATVDSLYTEQEVLQDARQFGDWVLDGTWFYAPTENAVYRLNVETEPYTFVLERAGRLHPEPAGKPTGDTEYGINSVSELAGEISGGYLKGIPPATTVDLQGTTISNTGEFLIIDPSKSDATSLDDIEIDSHPINLRFTDGTPQSLINEVNEKSRSDSSSSNVLVYSVNGSRSSISHLLPPTTENPSTTVSPPSAGVGMITADGGKATHRASPETEPYFPSELDAPCRWVETSPHPSDTFSEPNLRKYVLHHMEGKVLDACAGPTDLSQWYTDGQIVTNDLHPEIESDLSVDVAELSCHLEPESFDTIMFDPPWSVYQSNTRYEGFMVYKDADDDLPQRQISVDVRELPFKVPGRDRMKESSGGEQVTLMDEFGPDTDPDPYEPSEAAKQFNEKHEEYIGASDNKGQVGHTKLAKLGFDYLLKPGGKVIEFSYNGSIMAADLGYEKVDRATFNPYGEAKVLCAGVDVKIE